jgi:NitT/TauT family transport system substrate-binding protein
MNRRGVAFSLAAIVVVTVAGFFFLNRNQSQSEPTAVSVRLAWVYDMAEVGLFLGKDSGAFADNGIKLTIEPGGFGLDPIRLVASGTSDFGVAGAGNLLLARSQGVPVVAIGAEFQNTPVGFVVREDSDIQSFADFRGRRIGVQTGADTDVLYRALLARNNMKNTDVREVPIQYDAVPFVANKIDVLPAYVTNQPVTLRRQGVNVRVISAASQGLDYYGNVYFTTEKMIRENPELVRSFLRATRRGWEGAFSNKQAAIDSVKSRSEDFDAGGLGEIYDAVMPFIRPENGPFLTMSQVRWQTTKDVLSAAGLLTSDVDINRAFTNDFIQ